MFIFQFCPREMERRSRTRMPLKALATKKMARYISKFFANILCFPLQKRYFFMFCRKKDGEKSSKAQASGMNHFLMPWNVMPMYVRYPNAKFYEKTFADTVLRPRNTFRHQNFNQIGISTSSKFSHWSWGNQRSRNEIRFSSNRT